MTSDRPSIPQSGGTPEDRPYLNLAQIGGLLGVSARTVARYRSEYAPYLSPYEPPGGGRGLRRDAVSVLEVVHELKSRRAHWAEIKEELDRRFGASEAYGSTVGSKIFQRSLESIRQSHQLMTAELRLLFGEVNRRLDALEEDVKMLQSLLPLPQRLAEERTRRELTLSRARQLIEQQKRQISLLKGESPKSESLFPDESDLGHSESDSGEHES